MTIHHFNIFGCPFCGHIYRSPVYGSYNTFIAKYWSDGEVTHGVPEYYPVLKCLNPTCGSIFFTENATVVGETINVYLLGLSEEILDKYPPNPPEWENATHIHYACPDFNDLWNFLERNPEIISEREFTLRKESIIRYNDRFRKDPQWEPSPEEQKRMQESLKVMIELLGKLHDERDLLLMAEYHRELGEFDETIRILKDIKDEKLRRWKEKLFCLAKIRSKKLVDLNTIAIRKEYCCNYCKKSVYIFDQEKLETKLTYGVIYCSNCNHLSNTNLTMANPVHYYSRNLLQKLFIKYKPIVPVREPTCGLCNSKEITLFDIEKNKCPFCHIGTFEWVEWEW